MIGKPALAGRSSLLRSRRLPHLCIVLILLFGSFLNLSAQAPVAGHSLAAQIAAPDAGRWRIEVVDSEPSNSYNSLALDGSGRPHISYYDTNNLDLKHAWRDGTGWQIETVDSEGQVGLHTSLDVDAAGYPHISYFKCGDDCNSGELKYAWQDASGWYSETVDTGGATLSVRGFTSLALDGDGHAHISYLSYSNPPGSFDLKYAWRDGGGWYTEIVIRGIHDTLSFT